MDLISLLRDEGRCLARWAERLTARAAALDGPRARRAWLPGESARLARDLEALREQLRRRLALERRLLFGEAALQRRSARSAVSGLEARWRGIDEAIGALLQQMPRAPERPPWWARDALRALSEELDRTLRLEELVLLGRAARRVPARRLKASGRRAELSEALQADELGVAD